MTAEEKKMLSDNLYVEYLECFEKATEMFRACIETGIVDAWHMGNEYLQKADKINFMRLALA